MCRSSAVFKAFQALSQSTLPGILQRREREGVVANCKEKKDSISHESWSVEARTKEEAFELARLLMNEYRRRERDITEISRSLYALAKRWKFSYSLEDFTVEGVSALRGEED